MKKLFLFLLGCFLFFFPVKIFAAGGIYVSNNAELVIGETKTITITASGADFDELSGKITVTGPVSVESFVAGTATWATSPSINNVFAGTAEEPINSLLVATLSLKATGVGTAVVSVSDPLLKLSGEIVSSEAQSATLTIQEPDVIVEEVEPDISPDPVSETPPVVTNEIKAAVPPSKTLPGLVQPTSSTHPDPSEEYEANEIILSWNKESGVDGFSYYLGTLPDTTPTPAIDSIQTSVNYKDKKPGTYYFHIRAHNKDGWGETTHFKIKIKETLPVAEIREPEVNFALPNPWNIKISKGNTFVNDIPNGKVSGIVITGKTAVPGYTITATTVPEIILPEGKTLSVVSETNGSFVIVIDFPIPSGFYKLTIQGQKDFVLTPLSEEVIFEISQADGGNISILSEDDIIAETQPETEMDEEAKKLLNKKILVDQGILLITLISAVIILRTYIKKEHLDSI